MGKHAAVLSREKRSAAKEQLSFLVIMLALTLFRAVLNNIDDVSDLRPLHEPQPIPPFENTPSARECRATSCTLAFVPNDKCTQSIANTVIVQQEAERWLRPQGFQSDIAAEVFYLENPGTVLAVLSVALQPQGCACGGSPDCEMSYTIMINGSYLVGSSSKGWAEYRSISAGFVTVQNAVDEALLHLYARNVTAVRLRLQTTTQEYTVGLSFIGSSSIFGGLCLILSFIPNVHFLIMNIAEERRTAAHHELRCSGLLVSAFWASWLSWTLIMNGCVTLFVVSVSSFFGLFKGSNLPLCLLLFILYLSSCSTFAFFISSFFDRPQLAGAVGTTLYGLISCLYFLMRILDAKANVINWLFFLPPVAMGAVTESIWNGEARWNHLMSGRFPIFYNVCALTGGCLFYFVGVCWNSRTPKEAALEKSAIDDVELHSIQDGRRLVLQGIQLRHIYGETSGRTMLLPFLAHHQYSRLGSTVAIDGVDIDLCCGEILIILGPNGAGKSTLLSILSGRIAPANGRVSVFNGASVGYCPQSDLLVCWPQLTGLQHLQIYARVKLSAHSEDVNASLIETCINDALQLVQISDADVNRPVLEYSGGLRRLLSVAVALLDNPQILMLDEPFSSISHLECSILINSIRGFSSRGGSVIMATHNFSDVEELADRVAVLGDGCLKAIGTPRYFKQRFGAGFELRCDTELSDSGLLASHAHAVLQVVCTHVPESSIRSVVGSTMVFNIPATHEGLVQNSEMAEPLSILLSSLQKISHQLSITSCFISSVTLEQIFTSISHGGDSDKINPAPESTTSSDPLLLLPISTAAIRWNQFKAISLKKILVIRRDTRLMVYALVYPLLLFGAVIAMSYVDLPGFEAQAPLPFDIIMDDAIYHWRRFPVAVADGSDIDTLLTNMPLRHPLRGVCPLQRQCFDSRVFGKISDLYAYLRAQVILKEIRDDPTQLKKIQPDQEAAIQLSQTDGLSYFGGLRINSFSLNANEISCDAVLVFNNSAEHSASYVQSILSNAFLSIIKSSKSHNSSSDGHIPSVSDIKTSIVTRSRPLPFKHKFVDVGALVQALGCLLIFTWSVPLVTEIIVRERQARIFQQLKLLGLPPFVLWLSYLVVDSVFISVPIIITLLVGRVTNKGSFSINYFPATALLCIFYAPAMASFAHVSSFAFIKPDFVLKYLTIMIFVSAGSLFGTLAALSISDPGLASLVEWVLGFYPPCALAWGIFQLASRSAFDSQGAVTNITQLILPNLIQLALSSFMLTASCILLDTFWLHFLSDDTPQSSRPTLRSETPREDADVRNERTRVKSMLRNELHSPRCIIASQLSKVYGDVVTGIPALFELSLVSQAGEITCVVGPSGCGKSTIVSILAGACRASGGTFDFRDNMNISREGYRRQIGVVFQSDTVWDELTPREYLSLSFCISGLPNSMSLTKVSQAISLFGLESYADMPARALSLGCRRKMCVAAVLLGQLPFIIFDEPLIGFDANSKQNFWTLLEKVVSLSSRLFVFGILFALILLLHRPKNHLQLL
jgi:ABC-2 type transport system ATP-binding protein